MVRDVYWLGAGDTPFSSELVSPLSFSASASALGGLPSARGTNTSAVWTAPLRLLNGLMNGMMGKDENLQVASGSDQEKRRCFMDLLRDYRMGVFCCSWALGAGAVGEDKMVRAFVLFDGVKAGNRGNVDGCCCCCRNRSSLRRRWRSHWAHHDENSTE